MKAVVLHSGGIDSTTLLYDVAKGLNVTHIVTISINYGGIHNEAEARAARHVRSHFAEVFGHRMLGIAHCDIELDPLVFSEGHSALMGDINVPDAEYVEAGPQPTIVPFRNANLISQAVAYAMAQEYDTVYAAVHAADHEEWAYPDCSPEFMGAMAAAVYVGTYHKVRLLTPFIYMDKAQVVEHASLIGAPLHLTYSCYRGGAIQCGNCPTCRERMRAFYYAGYRDPTTYVRYPSNLGDIDPTEGLDWDV